MGTSTQKLCTMLIANDQVIIAEDEDICYMLRMLYEEYQKRGFTIITNKTEYIVVGNTCRDILLERGVDSYKRRHKCKRNKKYRIRETSVETATFHLMEQSLMPETKIKI